MTETERERNDTLYTNVYRRPARSVLLTVYVVSSGYIKCCKMRGSARPITGLPNPASAFWLAGECWNLIYKGDFFENQFFLCEQRVYWMNHKKHNYVCYSRRGLRFVFICSLFCGGFILLFSYCGIMRGVRSVCLSVCMSVVWCVVAACSILRISCHLNYVPELNTHTHTRSSDNIIVLSICLSLWMAGVYSSF